MANENQENPTSETTQAAAEGAEAPKKPKGPRKPTPPKPAYSRRTKRTMGRNKRREKLATDKEFAKTFFAARSKRSDDKKAAYRKRHSASASKAG